MGSFYHLITSSNVIDNAFINAEKYRLFTGRQARGGGGGEVSAHPPPPIILKFTIIYSI